ncbi:uncharacterized protein [Miscanthus floridulus]|uniref:uncharacterized protein isoform X2 n=1 Tax=Miscanthus floridulus TaxID=154761 RepID=UPI00345A37D6
MDSEKMSAFPNKSEVLARKFMEIKIEFDKRVESENKTREMLNSEQQEGADTSGVSMMKRRNDDNSISVNNLLVHTRKREGADTSGASMMNRWNDEKSIPCEQSLRRHC